MWEKSHEGAAPKITGVIVAHGYTAARVIGDPGAESAANQAPLIRSWNGILIVPI